MASRSPDKNLLPLFYEGDIITGTVSLYLKSKEPIREISVTVTMPAHMYRCGNI